MKPLFSLVLIIMTASLSMLSCQKATLIDEYPDSDSDARGEQQTEQNDTVNVTTDITTDGWEGSIDVGFEFG